jgi:hypothetical protein
MRKGVGSKQGKGSGYTSLDLSEESTSTIEVTIPDQRSQAESKLWGKGSPDPCAPQASASALLSDQRAFRMFGPMGFWCFF